MFRIVLLIIISLALGSFYTPEIKLPEFETNSTQADSVIWKTHQLINHEYKFLISLEKDSNWLKEKASSIVLCLNEKNKWYLIKIERNKKINESIIVSRNFISRKKSEYIWPLISILNESKFLALDKDSLNVNTVKTADTMINGQAAEILKTTMVSDGIQYRFEVISKNNHRVISAYSPIKMFEYLPEIWQRGVFIEFLEKYQETLMHLK